jgi:hypothetical protein
MVTVGSQDDRTTGRGGEQHTRGARGLRLSRHPSGHLLLARAQDALAALGALPSTPTLPADLIDRKPSERVSVYLV